MRYDLLHPKALRAALLKAKIRGVPTEHQVRNWTSGRTPVPEWVRPHIERLVALPEIQEEAAPSMTRRLLAGVIALERKSGVSPDELAAAESEADQLLEMQMEADARLGAELEQSQHKPDGRVGDQGGGQVGGPPDRTRRKPK